jgi:hypothetical protein
MGYPLSGAFSDTSDTIQQFDEPGQILRGTGDKTSMAITVFCSIIG